MLSLIHIFLEFLECALEEIIGTLGEEHLGQLLCDRAGAAFLPQEYRSTQGAANIHATVLPEPFVLRGDQRLHHVGTDLRIIHRDPVLLVILAHLRTIAEEDGRGQITARILEVLCTRKITVRR